MPLEPQAQFESGAAELISQFGSALTEVGAATCDGLPAADGDLIVAEGVRHSLRLASHAALMMMECDPAYPYFIKAESIERQYGLPAVDCVYHYSPLRGDHSYTISGHRGSAHVFEIEIWRGHQSRLKDWAYFGTTQRRIAPGEALNLRLSRRRQDGDWLELPAGDCCVMIRQYYNDWDTEAPAYLQIERDGAVYPPPQLSLAEVRTRMSQAMAWMRTVSQASRHVVQQYLAADPGGLTVIKLPFGFARLHYLGGHYRCEPDQAIIMEVEPPPARYWNFQLGNVQWEALDYHLRRTAINGFQAHVDTDGVFRAVISHSDPGVANWLDTAGRSLGLISGRYLDSDSAPIPTLRTVPLSMLERMLPAGTRRVTPQERQRMMRARMLSTVRRQCGD